MNLKTKLAAAIMLAGSATMAQATTYNVHAVFQDGGIQGITEFTGSFDWNGTTVSNFTGNLSESMFAWDATNKRWWDPLSNYNVASIYTGDIYDATNANGTYANGAAPLLHLTYDNVVPASVSNGQVTAMTFLKNDTNVVAGGGYEIDGSKGGNAMAFGYDFTKTPAKQNQNARNNNGFFTLVFNAADPTNTAGLVNKFQYADETRLGMMGPYMTGWLGMTGLIEAAPDPATGGPVYGSMGGFPTQLTITAATSAPVPVPAAAWLFGGGLLSLIGASRRKRELAA